MTNVKFNRREFEKHLKITKEIEEKISLFGTPLEKITDDEIEIEVFPNRPDLISMHGFLRSFKAFLGKEETKKYQIKKPKLNYQVKISPSVKDIRPYTVCAIIENMKFDEEKIKEIIDLQEKLHITIGRNRKKVAIGIYPLEKISLPIKYEARVNEKIKFIPLDSEKEMSPLQTLKKHPKGIEFAHLLEKSSLFPIFIDSKDKILSMPPIINSEETGRVTAETKNIFIECSGSDFNTLNKTLNILVTVLADMGGTIYQMELDYENKKIITPDLTLQKMKISIENINSLLGLNLKEKDIEKLLSKMGYEYKNKTVLVPAWRTDILHEVDLIEDVAIAYGYDKLIPEIPNVATIGEESQESKIKRKIAELLIGLGLIEISTFHLIKQREAEIMKIDKKIELENSKTEYKILRPSLLILSLRILAENKDHDYPQEIFEIGKTFSADAEDKTETGILEKENLIISYSPGNFTKMKQILNYLNKSLNINLETEKAENKNCIEGRAANICLNNKKIGYMGEVHPETLRDWGIKMPVSVLEISLEEIFNII